MSKEFRKTIVVFGGHAWNNKGWFRKQHFAQLLSSQHKVIYVQPSQSIIRSGLARLRWIGRPQYESVSETLTLMTPPPLFPFPNSALGQKINAHVVVSGMKHALARYGQGEAVLWNYRPVLTLAQARIPWAKVVFDLCDDVAYYRKVAGDEVGFRRDQRLVEKSLRDADVVICSAWRLKDKYDALARGKMILAPNGFSGIEQRENDIDEDPLASVPHPIVGFVGTLFRFIDEAVLYELCTKLDAYQFVFVGAVESSFRQDRLASLPNTRFLGAVPKERVRDYIASFDVCLNVFAQNDVTDSVNPLKVYDYLQAGKPVVSSRMMSLEKERIASYVRFCDSADEMVKAIQSLSGKSNDVPEDVLAAYDWKAIFETMMADPQLTFLRN